MNKIKVLDCTLRDGGYVNNWEFGENAIHDIRNALDEIGVDFIELGFFRDELYRRDRSIFSNIDTISQIIGTKNDGTVYGGLIEMANYFPLDKLSYCSEEGPQALRYSFWKRLTDDAYAYGEQIIKKGYKLCFQPTRIEQYTEEEFVELCKRFSELNPYAIYIVDTFGLLHERDLIRYAEIGNEYLAPDIILGYHAHDNMGQAFKNTCTFLEQDFGERTLQVDASMFGMGRGAGNLRLEQILEYLNYAHGGDYNLSPIYRMWDKYLKDIMKKSPWGYDLAYFITAEHCCNPNYAKYYLEKALSVEKIEEIICSIKGEDIYLYSDEKAQKYAEIIK